MATETKARRSRKKTEEPAVAEEVAFSDPNQNPAAETTEITVHQPPASSPAVMSEGTYALAMLSDDEFQSRLEVLKRGRDRVKVLQESLMIPGEDYGLIPNTPKPTLFKSGAEKLCQFYRLAARLEVEVTYGDNESTPPLAFSATCYLHLGSLDGPVVATGHGNANGWEKRYIRGGSKACPDCGATALIVGKYGKNAGGWYCFPKKGGCGKDFPKNDPAIVSQTDTKGAVTEAYDLANTLMKMAEKRAFVDATLRATATSGLFTQDVVEDPRDDEDTVVTEGGAVVDGSTGEVRGREDSGYYEKHGTNPNEQAVDDEQSRHDAAAAEHQRVAAETGAYVAKGEDVEKVLGRPDPLDEPEFRSSNVEGIGRGGVTDKPTDAQLNEISRLAKAIQVEGEAKPGLGPWKLADEISTVVGGGIDSTELPEDRGEAGKQVAAFLRTMDPNDVGNLITALRRMAEA